MTADRWQFTRTFVAFVLLVAAAAAFGAQFMPGAWYAGIAKPAWTPPNAIFAPVWTLLYVMIALAGTLVWRSGDRTTVIGMWLAGLVFNALWSLLFFGLHWTFAALIDIGLLWITIVGFIMLSRRSSPWASGLFVPYLAWVSFAAALNFAIWRLNG